MFYGYSFFLSYQMGLQHWATLKQAEPYASILSILWMAGSLLAAANPKLWPARLSVTMGLLLFLGLHLLSGSELPLATLTGLIMIVSISVGHLVWPDALRLRSATVPAAACALTVAIYFFTGFAAHYLLLAVLTVYNPPLMT